MRMLSIFLGCVFIGLSALGADVVPSHQPWTWLHRKKFTSSEQELNKNQKEMSYKKINLPVFTQLVFSWNALRPQKGHFTFYAQVRNVKTGQWGKWHRMMSWGAGVQKSFKTEADDFSSYHHVRLEALDMVNANAFAIRIEANEGADLSLLKLFAVNLANLNEFQPENHTQLGMLPSISLKGVPRFSQFELLHERNDSLCSPTSCAMMLSYLMSEPVDPVHFAEGALDTGLDKYGSWPFNMAHAFERAGGKIAFAVTRLSSFKKLYDHLAKGIPVVVSVRGYIQGAPKVYPHGHLLVVIGYDHKTREVICHDPAVPEAKLLRKRYLLKNFLQAWERSHRLAYLADPLV